MSAEADFLPDSPDGSYACPSCGTRISVGMFPFCKGPASHGQPYVDVPFKAFELDVDGSVHRFESLHQVREFERHSEQRFRDGKGAQLAFRAFNNDMGGGRQLSNVFGSPPNSRVEKRIERGQQMVTVKRWGNEPPPRRS